MSFAMTQEWRSRLLRPRLVREDVFIQGLRTTQALRCDPRYARTHM
jgi:hypothetical protein